MDKHPQGQRSDPGKIQEPLDECATVNLCFKDEFWKTYLVDTSDNHHMTTTEHTVVSKILEFVTEVLAAHIDKHDNLIRVFSWNNFRGSSVFLKTTLIHDQNMVPGTIPLDPSLVNTSRMINVYMSPTIVPSLKDVSRVGTVPGTCYNQRVVGHHRYQTPS